MYQVEASKALLKPRLWARPPARLRVPRNVVMLGMVSMLTDVSSEMVATVLPLYLVFTLGASPLALGAIDGTYRGAAALVQVASGFASDRWRRPKEVAGARLRDLGGRQGGAGRGRQHDRRDRRDRRLRPGRQGDPHRAARRADLALQQQSRPRHRLRRAPGDGLGRRDARAAGRLRHPARRAGPLRRRLRRQHPLRRARPRGPGPDRAGQAANGRLARPPTRPRCAPPPGWSATRASPCCWSPRPASRSPASPTR